jgi:hypothetical protein
MQIETWDWEVRRVIFATWQRLPADVQRQLDHVRFTDGAHPERKAMASAGQADVDILRLPPTTKGAIGLIAHECAHVALAHSDKLHSGEISHQQAEVEADALVRRWGFDAELNEAYLYRR